MRRLLFIVLGVCTASFGSLDFLFLDTSGREVVPAAPNGTYPFGVMIKKERYQDSKTGEWKTGTSTCSCAHIAEGVVTLNNHCITNGATPDESVIYFDKNGRKSVAKVTAYRLRGNQKGLDLAIVEIDSASAKNWHTLPGNGDRDGFIGRRDLQQAKNVTIWSFDPIRYHPHLAKYHDGENGVVYNPKNCLASEKQPSTKIEVDGKERVSKMAGYSASAHIFIDHCDSTLRTGNSGSIITMSDDFSKKVGAIHWTFPYENYWKSLVKQGLYGSNANYSYYGNRGVWERMDMHEMDKNIYSVGTLFESMLRMKSSLFRPGSAVQVAPSTDGTTRRRSGLE